MTMKQLQQRIEKLEQQLESLQLAARNRKRDWQTTLGMFEGDEAMKEIAHLGRLWRESERRKARSGTRSRRQKAKT
jgi:hypothetical protein